MPAAATTSRTDRRDCSAVWIIDFESACDMPAMVWTVAVRVSARNEAGAAKTCSPKEHNTMARRNLKYRIADTF